MTRFLAPRFRPCLDVLEERCTPSAASRFLAPPETDCGAAASRAAPAFVPPANLPASHAAGHSKSDAHAVPFKVKGGGTAPLGLPVFPGGMAPHNATGAATHLGKYTGDEGSFELLSLDPATLTGTFRGSFVFAAANGDRLACDYGADPDHPGTFTLTPTADGKVVAVFVAEFTPVPEESTGRFANVSGGSFTMVATSEPFALTPNIQGYTPPFAYTWVGEGSLEFGRGKK